MKVQPVYITIPQRENPRCRCGVPGTYYNTSPGVYTRRPDLSAGIDLNKFVTLPTLPVQAQADSGLKEVILIAVGLLVVGGVAIALINRK